MDIPSPPIEPLSPRPSSSSAVGNRLDALDAQVGSFASQLSSMEQSMKSLSSAILNSRQSVEHFPNHDSYGPSESESEDPHSDGELVEPSELDPWGISAPSPPPLVDSFFDPVTIEREPDIPDPLPALQAQGIKCQRLGEASWNRIRYAEAEKRLRRGGVFQPLAKNHLLGSSAGDGELQKSERLLATSIHALLAQRQAFKEATQALVQRCPQARSHINEIFSESSSFRAVSDDFLQFLCGKRAEVIDARRRSFEHPSHLGQILQNIPPSSSHLFAEEALTKSLSSQPSALLRESSFRKRQLPASQGIPHKKTRYPTQLSRSGQATSSFAPAKSSKGKRPLKSYNKRKVPRRENPAPNRRV
uniref:Uncharacterized protein n=1 Tax=Cacopsylla melanoneura TaxID=428564 RepID=A0A8D8SWA1_9HEMI